ncbi:MAG: hypothetical protein CMJ64_08250 [Planctomycetaceae bacterium]|nr:hypothetical protein [Planctomycetaceae bacterium]
METDRNLLFALLALQLEYIDSEQFAAACAAWSSDRSTPLAELVRERKWLSDEQRDEVERRLEQKVEQNGGNAAKTLALEATVEMSQAAAAATRRLSKAAALRRHSTRPVDPSPNPPRLAMTLLRLRLRSRSRVTNRLPRNTRSPMALVL